MPTHLCDYLENSAARSPERVAAVDPDGAFTYAQLNDYADRIAGFLLDQGVKPGDRVGVVLPKTIRTFALLFGIMKVRAAYVPVDWTGPVERAAQILTSCQVRVAFVDSRLRTLGGTAETIIPFDDDAWDNILQHESLESDVGARNTDDLAYILYTSGSSGIPKGVMLTQQNATSYVDWCTEILAATEDDRFGNHAPFHFAMCILDLYVPIRQGGSVHLVPEGLGKNPKDLARFIASHRLTIWYSTPAILGLLAEFGELSRLDCSSLRWVLFAGEPFPIKRLRRIMELWPQANFCNLWGSTETNACTRSVIPRPVPDDRAEPYPIGRAGSYCSAIVLDDEARPVSPGDEGLLYISGPSVFKGYWGRPIEGTFLIRDGLKWHNTGDVVKEREGEGFVYVGRRDRMVKRRGYRVELAEVERCLDRHPGIAEAAVIALPDTQSDVQIIAYLAAPMPRPSRVDVKTFTTQHLPAYMSPDIFVFIDALPRTRSNKVDYQTLIQRFQAEESTRDSG
jgi:amino acid adenylation domain-containing protein